MPLRERLKDTEELACIMGYLPEQFWRFTPQEFAVLHKAWKQRQQMEDRRVARICSVIANTNRNPKKCKKPFTEDDFMPVEKKKSEKQSAEKMLEVVKMLNLAYGGKGGEN